MKLGLEILGLRHARVWARVRLRVLSVAYIVCRLHRDSTDSLIHTFVHYITPDSYCLIFFYHGQATYRHAFS